MHNNDIYKISKNVLKRYEESIDGGTFFLFNTINQSIWTGNYTSKLLIDMIDGKNTLENLKKNLSFILNSALSSDIVESVENIISELLQLEMIYLVQEDTVKIDRK